MASENQSDEYRVAVATKNVPIGISDGAGGVISFCCHEQRHQECSGMTEAALSSSMRAACACQCHANNSMKAGE
jgi:hypothetical protein